MTEAIQTLFDRAREARAEGRPADARNAYAQAAALGREAGAPLLRAHALCHLSDLDREARRPAEALAHAEQALALSRRHAGADEMDLTIALRLMALALDDLGRGEAATALWTEARDRYAAAGITAGVAECEARLDA